MIKTVSLTSMPLSPQGKMEGSMELALGPLMGAAQEDVRSELTQDR